MSPVDGASITRRGDASVGDDGYSAPRAAAISGSSSPVKSMVSVRSMVGTAELALLAVAEAGVAVDDLAFVAVVAVVAVVARGRCGAADGHARRGRAATPALRFWASLPAPTLCSPRCYGRPPRSWPALPSHRALRSRCTRRTS